MAINRFERDITIDFASSDQISGSNFSVVQGSNNTLLHIKFTNDGSEITTGTYDIEIFLVTTDSLDFRNSVRLVKTIDNFQYNQVGTDTTDLDYDGLNLVYALDSDNSTNDINVPEIFQTKGHCQLIIYVDGVATLPLDYYVIDNPTFNIR